MSFGSEAETGTEQGFLKAVGFVGIVVGSKADSRFFILVENDFGV